MSVYTPATLAERWECSKTTIIRMMMRGDIRRNDFPLIRFSEEEVHRIENDRDAMAPGVVYFIEAAGLIKIGHTTDIIYRHRTIAATSPVPVKLIGHIPGTRADEKILHKRFKALRSHGEWFKNEGDLSDFISAACGNNVDKSR
jgi:hypothetical protein